MRRVWWLGIAATQGCFVDWESLDAACLDTVGGQDLVEADAASFLRRVSCYRRYVNLEEAWVGHLVQPASEAHAAYIELNGILDPESQFYNPTLDGIFNERPGLQSFTGVSSFDRLTASYALGEETDTGLWQFFFAADSLSDPTYVDSLMANPWTRDVLFQPWWRGAGLATGETPTLRFAYMDIVYTVPAITRMDRPVVYPRDGQENVPTQFITGGAPDDPLSVHPVVGFPISILVGSYETTNNRTNPYGLYLVDATITGPDGELSWVYGEPGNYSWGSNQSTVIIAPREPLLPLTTYTVEATITWNARTNKLVTTTFTTGDGTLPF